MADEVRARVIAAVEAGRLPRGPSDAAARNLLDDLPAGYWQCWGDAAAERIRARASARAAAAWTVLGRAPTVAVGAATATPTTAPVPE